MPRRTSRVGPTPLLEPDAIGSPRVVVRLHTRPTRQARWELLGEFATREEAWAVLVKLPSRTHVWLNDVFSGEHPASTPARRVH